MLSKSALTCRDDGTQNNLREQPGVESSETIEAQSLRSELDPTFTQSLPRSPFVRRSDSDLPERIECLAEASTYPYIMGNPSSLILHITFALTDPDRWLTEGLPMPNWYLPPEANLLAQVSYCQKSPVNLGSDGSRAAQSYLFAIESAYASRMEAAILTRTWIRNPMLGAVLRSEPYTLQELADFAPEHKRLVPLTATKKTRTSLDVRNRNRTLFEWASKASRAIQSDFLGVSSEELQSRVRAIVDQGNSTFSDPLPSNELASITKSIAGYLERLPPGRAEPKYRGRDGHGRTRHLEVHGGMLRLEDELPDHLPQAEVTRRQQIAGRTTAQNIQTRNDRILEDACHPGLKPQDLKKITGLSIRTVERWFKRRAGNA